MNPVRRITARARQPKRKRRQLFTCGSCGKGYSNPLGHNCTGGGDFARRRRREDKAAKQAAARAAAAKRRAGEQARIAAARNAERQKTAQRVAEVRAAERARADARVARARGKRPAPSRGPAHRYQACRDEECARPACVAYRDGRADEAASAGREAL